MSRPIDLRTTLQKVRVPSFVVNRAGVVTSRNDAAGEKFGDVEGRAFSRIIPSESAAFVQRKLDRGSGVRNPSRTTPPRC